MTNKQMMKNELIYLLNERNAKAKTLNEGIKEINECNSYDDMLKVYNKYDELTK